MPMALTPKQKAKATKPLKRHALDTGSPEYQVALLTEEIKKLTDHLKINKKDFHSRRGLLGLVGQRKRLLQYLRLKDQKRYAQLIESLELRK